MIFGVFLDRIQSSTSGFLVVGFLVGVSVVRHHADN